MKRVVVMSDPHCGHVAGLTPPGYQINCPKDCSYTGKSFSFFKNIEVELWNWYAEKMKELQPIDVLIINGDMIDGKQEKSRGTELIAMAADLKVQRDIACACIAKAQAKKIYMTYGTNYHTMNEEKEIAEKMNAVIDDHLFIEINGVCFDVKHKIGKSSIPHGRATPLIRTKLWNMIWKERGNQPNADITIRSHVHYFQETATAKWRGFITPSLQAYSKFGANECEGDIDIGLLEFNIDKKGGYSCQLHDLEVKAAKPKVRKA